MAGLIYILPRNNPEYFYKQVLNDINTNFSGITSGLISISGATSGSSQNFYTTGATLVGDTIVFDRNDLLSAYTVNLSPIAGGGGPTSIARTFMFMGG